MIRHLRPCTDAYMELKHIDTKAQNASDINLSNHRHLGQQPQIQLKSKQVQDALKNKREEKQEGKEKQSETPVPGSGPAALGVNARAQKPFQSIDHNQIVDLAKLKENAKRQTFIEQKHDAFEQNQIRPAEQQPR